MEPPTQESETQTSDYYRFSDTKTGSVKVIQHDGYREVMTQTPGEDLNDGDKYCPNARNSSEWLEYRKAEQQYRVDHPTQVGPDVGVQTDPTPQNADTAWIKEMESRQAQMEDELSKLKKYYGNLEGQLAKRYGELKKQQNKLLECYGDLKGKHDDLKQQHDQLETRYDDLEGEYDNLNQQHDKLDKCFGGLREEHDNLNKKHDKLETCFGGLKEEHDMLNKKHDKLSEKHDKLKKKHDKLPIVTVPIQEELKKDVAYAGSSSSACPLFMVLFLFVGFLLLMGYLHGPVRLFDCCASKCHFV